MIRGDRRVSIADVILGELQSIFVRELVHRIGRLTTEGTCTQVSERVKEPNSIYLQDEAHVPRLCLQSLNEDPDNIDERVLARHPSLPCYEKNRLQL